MLDRCMDLESKLMMSISKERDVHIAAIQDRDARIELLRRQCEELKQKVEESERAILQERTSLVRDLQGQLVHERATRLEE